MDQNKANEWAEIKLRVECPYGAEDWDYPCPYVEEDGFCSLPNSEICPCKVRKKGG